jgi:hypothetical protein
MATTLKLDNHGKPTPPGLRRLGRILVILMPVVTAVLLVVPIVQPWKDVIVVGTNALLALGKELTTYTFDPEKVPMTYFPQPSAEQFETKDVTKTVEKIAEIELTLENK